MLRVALTLVCCLVPVLAAAAESATASVAVTAQFSSRTSLKVSTEVLRFDVLDGLGAATASVDFSAAARTQSGAEVTLSLESTRATESAGMAGDEPPLTFSGAGPGTLAGEISRGRAAVGGRWIGSGLRTGRFVFTLRADTPGAHIVPIQFVLSAP